MTSYPKVLVDESTYGDDFNKDCVFTDPEALVSLGRYGLLPKESSYLEPACGIGNLSKPLIERDYQVESSDLMNWGYGPIKNICDYGDKAFDIVLTNPPYSKWQMFIEESLRIARQHVFLLFPTRYLEGQARSYILRETQLTAVLVFSYRLRMYRPTGIRLSGLTSYSWFHWNLEEPRARPILDWLYR